MALNSARAAYCVIGECLLLRVAQSNCSTTFRKQLSGEAVKVQASAQHSSSPSVKVVFPP